MDYNAALLLIRTATLDDLPDIVAIYNEAVRQRFATADLEPVSVEGRTAWFFEHDPATLPIYVADRGGAVLGWCSLSAYRAGRAALRGTAEISYYVSADSRRQGVGTTLIGHAVDQAPRLGLRVLFGILLEKNTTSIDLIKKCGFELWGYLPDVAEIDGQRMGHVYYGRRI